MSEFASPLHQSSVVFLHTGKQTVQQDQKVAVSLELKHSLGTTEISTSNT